MPKAVSNIARSYPPTTLGNAIARAMADLITPPSRSTDSKRESEVTGDKSIRN